MPINHYMSWCLEFEQSTCFGVDNFRQFWSFCVLTYCTIIDHPVAMRTLSNWSCIPSASASLTVWSCPICPICSSCFRVTQTRKLRIAFIDELTPKQSNSCGLATTWDVYRNLRSSVTESETNQMTDICPRNCIVIMLICCSLSMPGKC